MKKTDHDKYEVRAIENGTVIDHIPSASLFKIIAIMELSKLSNRMSFATNLESKRLGRKAIIKINDRYCAPEEISKIAIFAPNAVVNIIKSYEVAEKLRVTPPETIGGFIRCINPKCITNNEPVKSSFDVLNNDSEISLRCRYCERITYKDQF